MSLREHVGHEARLLVDPGPVAVADGDAGRLLAAVLQREQPEERELGDALAVRRRDAEHAALLLGRVVVDVADAWHGDCVGHAVTPRMIAVGAARRDARAGRGRRRARTGAR